MAAVRASPAGTLLRRRLVVIKKHGRPSVVVLSVQDLETLEDTLDLLPDPNAMADLLEAAAARHAGQTIELAMEEALERWTRG